MAKKSQRIAVFPGTFDPVTLGHLDVIERGRRLFDHVIVAIGRNPDKTELFPLEERLEMIRRLVPASEPGLAKVTVEAYKGLTVELVRRRRAVAILRGLRNMTDLEYEFQLALTNRAVAGVDTVFIMTSERLGFTSSSLIRQIATLGGPLQSLSGFLPKLVIARLRDYRKNKSHLFTKLPVDPDLH